MRLSYGRNAFPIWARIRCFCLRLGVAESTLIEQASSSTMEDKRRLPSFSWKRHQGTEPFWNCHYHRLFWHSMNGTVRAWESPRCLPPLPLLQCFSLCAFCINLVVLSAYFFLFSLWEHYTCTSRHTIFRKFYVSAMAAITWTRSPKI